MEKRWKMILLLGIILLFSACSRRLQETTATSRPSSASKEKQEELKTMSKENILIAYFSRAGENYNVGFVEKGNTAFLAEMIAEEINGELFEIQTVKDYPEGYEETKAVVQEEQERNERPELSNDLDSLEAYDTLFIGYPIWWGDMPLAVYSFLESHEFAGERVIPFCTHEGSGLATTPQTLQRLVSEANVLAGLSISGKVAQESQDKARAEVREWLKSLGFID